MKRILWMFFLCALLFVASPALALPPVAARVLINGDFFTTFKGYDDCFLYDIERLDGERIGAILLDSIAFRYLLVFDVKTNEVLYRDLSIPEKKKRGAMRRESIFVADAVRLGKAAMAHIKTKRALSQSGDMISIP